MDTSVPLDNQGEVEKGSGGRENLSNEDTGLNISENRKQKVMK